MKRKTFANLRTAALGLLLLEAMLLLVLLLVHTGASAEDSGFFGAAGEAAGFIGSLVGAIVLLTIYHLARRNSLALR